MNSISLIVLAVAVWWCPGPCSAAAAAAVVDYRHVLRATVDPNVLIVDVRSPVEVSDLGHIPSSINIPLNDVRTALGSMPAGRFLSVYGRQKQSTNTEIIFYCTVGFRAGRAQQTALNLGYTNVKNYRGSYTDWVQQHQH